MRLHVYYTHPLTPTGLFYAGILLSAPVYLDDVLPAPPPSLPRHTGVSGGQKDVGLNGHGQGQVQGHDQAQDKGQDQHPAHGQDPSGSVDEREDEKADQRQGQGQGQSQSQGQGQGSSPTNKRQRTGQGNCS